jgi:hypothetical protein
MTFSLGALPSALQAAVQFYTTLAPASLDRMDHVYDLEAEFIDPFNHVQGLPAIDTIFRHMFTAMQSPRFEVVSALMASNSNEAFLRWNFYFSKRGLGDNFCIHGSSYLRFNPAGKIAYHQDYWDSGKELYEKLPLIGALIRWLSKQMRTPQP